MRCWVNCFPALVEYHREVRKTACSVDILSIIHAHMTVPFLQILRALLLQSDPLWNQYSLLRHTVVTFIKE